MPTIDSVAPGTPIASAWGNDVATEVNVNCVKKSGATMTGALLLPSTQSANAQAAVHKSYVDTTTVALTGDTMTGMLTLPATNPTAANHATRKGYVDALADARVAVDGDIMSGHLQVGSEPDTWQGIDLGVTGSVASTVLGTAAGGDSTAVSPNLRLIRAGAPAADVTGRFASLRRSAGGVSANTEIGSITIASASSVAYNTTSDQRLKEKTGEVDDAADIIQSLGALAYRGRWIADQGQGEEWVFLNSQDVEPAAPYAVAGAGDAVDGEGNPIPQQLDHSALVPLLVAALAQALDRIAALEAA